MDKILHLVGLAKRAGRLEAGEEPVGAACRARACRLILVARDAADNSIRRVRHFADAGQCLWIRVPWDKAELGAAAGRSVCAMAAVTDAGLAAAIAEQLARESPETYGEAAGKLAAKAERINQRRREKQKHENKLRRQGRSGKPYIPTRIKRRGETQSEKQS